MKKTFTTSQEAEDAFYGALARADLDAMMEVWAEDEEVVCVHPGGPRLAGYEPVRTSWKGMFTSGQKLRVKITEALIRAGTMYAIHSVHEHISAIGDAGEPAVVISTNVYVRTSGGWRMIEHHGSIAPTAPRPASEVPKILH